MDSKQDLGPIKVTLLGASGTGKTCLMGTLAGDLFKQNTESTIGASYRTIKRNLGQDKAYTVEFWDTSGQERFSALNSIYTKKADAVLIALNPAQMNETTEISDSEKGSRQVNTWQYQINQYTKSVREVSSNAEILYVVTHADNIDERKQNGEMEEEIKQAIKTAHQAQKGCQNEEPIIYWYSSASLDLASSAELPAKFHRDLLLEALDDVAVKKFKVPSVNKKQEVIILNDDAASLNKSPSFFTFSGFFKAAFFFSLLSVIFLSLGGVVGGVTQMWSNIDLMLEAIQFGTDWGIGVLVASLALALVITGAAVAWSYYCDHRGDGPDVLLEDQKRAEDPQQPNLVQGAKSQPPVKLKTENSPVSQPTSGDNGATEQDAMQHQVSGVHKLTN